MTYDTPLWLAMEGVQDPPSSFLEMGLRTLGIYIAAIAILRVFGEGRLLGKYAAFDIIVGVIFGSMISRPVNATAPFAETLAIGAILVALHWASGALAFRSHRFGILVKGSPRVLVERGVILWNEMKRCHFTEGDLEEALRLEGIETVEDVRIATMERNGRISILRRTLPKVLDVAVAEGVQTVRIELV